jgi:hypothetical protein
MCKSRRHNHFSFMKTFFSFSKTFLSDFSATSLVPTTINTEQFSHLKHRLSLWWRLVKLLIHYAFSRQIFMVFLFYFYFRPLDNKRLLKRSFSEIPTRFLTPYREFEQHPHTPHRRQLIFKFSLWCQKVFSRYLYFSVLVHILLGWIYRLPKLPGSVDDEST